MTDETKRYCTYCDKNVQSLGGKCPDCGNRTWETLPAQSHEHSQVLQEDARKLLADEYEAVGNKLAAWTLREHGPMGEVLDVATRAIVEGIRLGAERERAKICAFLYDHDPYWAEIIERLEHLSGEERGDHLFQDGVNL